MVRPPSSTVSPDSLRPVSTEPLLSIEETSARGSWTPRELRAMVRRGDVPAYKLGAGPRARLRFRWSEIEAALQPAGPATSRNGKVDAMKAEHELASDGQE
jgi:hypothetical protein